MDTIQKLQTRIIAAQRQALRELSTPVIPIMAGILIVPLVGTIDAERAREILRNLLLAIGQHRAQVVILDITGVPSVDREIVGYLHRAVQSARLKGTRTIVTGISETIAEMMVDMGIDWQQVETVAELQSGLEVALRYLHK